MADFTTQLLTEIRDSNQTIIRGLRHISRQNQAILKTASKPTLTVKRMWEDYGKPITSMLSWAPVVWLVQQVFRDGGLHGVFARLSGLF